jgi:hypothetical protein
MARNMLSRIHVEKTMKDEKKIGVRVGLTCELESSVR